MPIRGGSGSGGGGRGASDVRAGGAWFEVYAKDGLSGVLDRLKAKVTAFAAFMRRTGASLIGGGLALGAGPLGLLLGGARRAAGVGDLASVFGGDTATMSKIVYAFEAVGGSLEDAEAAMSRLAKHNQSGRPLDEVFQDTVNALNEMPPGFERAQAASEIFGKSYAKILDLGQDLSRLMSDAPIITKEQADSAEEFAQQMARTKIELQGAMLPLLRYLTPLVTMFSEFVRQNASLAAVAAIAAVGLVAIGLAFSAIGIALSAILSPLALVTAGVIALGVYFRNELAEAFRDIGQTFMTTWNGIRDAVAGGELRLAFEILTEGIKVAWFQMILDMGRAFDDFMNRNRGKLIALGSLLGGAKGAFVGGRFGPKGALIGGGLGALVGGGAAFGAGELARGIAQNTGLPERIAAGQARLDQLARQAADAARRAVAVENRAQLQQIRASTEAVKGGFNPASSLQQFGYGDNIKKQTEILGDILGEMRAAPVKIGGAVGDALRMK
jgi:hypothetical protein